MMMGVAQVMGMKPILRFGFSIAPPAGAWASASRAAPSGKKALIAANSVPAPTARSMPRRVASSG